jgi:hypothetical protein
MLTKETVVGEVRVSENGIISVLMKTRILEGGKVISENLHRTPFDPGADVSGCGDWVHCIAQAAWTDEVLKKWEADKAAQRAALEK